MPDGTTRNIPPQLRELRLLPESWNAETRTIDVVWSTGARVRRYDYWSDQFYDEELDMSPEAIDMSRLESGNVPVLDNHRVYGSISSQIGVVTRGWLENGEGHATLRLSSRDELSGIVDDILAGIIRNISIGYSVKRYQIEKAEGEVPLYRAVDWSVHEISFVTVPADAGASTRANPESMQGGSPCVFVRAETRTPSPETAMPNATAAATTAPAAETAERNQPTPPANAQAPAAEPPATDVAARAAEIVELCARHNMSTKAAEWIRAGHTIDKVRELILDERALLDANSGGHRNRVESGEDEADKRRGAVVDSILARAMVVDPVTKRQFRLEGANPFRGFSLVDLARSCLERGGVRTEGMTRMDLVGRAFTQSTSDFPILLENAMHKSLQAGYALAADTWQRWCARGTVSDFKAHKRYRVGSLGNLLSLTELAEFRNRTIPDGEKSSIQAGTKGYIINISRQAIINDDLSAFIGLSNAQGRAAARTIEADAHTLLASNPLMEDGFALFSAEHNNIDGAAVPSVTTFETGRQKMAKQKDVSGNDFLDLRPAIWLGPVSYGGLARVTNDSQYDPDAVNKLQRPNMVRGLVREVIDSPRIADAEWYLLADKDEAPVIEVAFLEGEETPFLDMEEGFTVDGTRYKVRLDFGVAAIDYRGAFRNKA